MVHHVAHSDPGVGVGEAKGATGPEVSEAARVRPEWSTGRRGHEPETEGDVLAEDRARAEGLTPRARIVAQVLIGSDPYYHLDTSMYAVYYRADVPKPDSRFTEEVLSEAQIDALRREFGAVW